MEHDEKSRIMAFAVTVLRKRSVIVDHGDSGSWLLALGQRLGARS